MDDLALEVAAIFADAARTWRTPDADIVAEARAEWMRWRDAQRKRERRLWLRLRGRRMCPICATVFGERVTGRKRVYCSVRCRVRAHRL